jgi:hypothetical protein
MPDEAGQDASGEPDGVVVTAASRLFLADLDNNGGLDVVASGSTGAEIWLAREDLSLHPLDVTIDAEVWSVIDLNGDGQLDLVGLAGGRPVTFTGKGSLGYHHHIIRPRAQSAAGDQRINSFGVGGEVEVRSGRLVQKQVISGAIVHLGLGSRTSVDVTRIVWPNGVPQAEFDPAIDRQSSPSSGSRDRVRGSLRTTARGCGSSRTSCGDRRWGCASTRRTPRA